MPGPPRLRSISAHQVFQAIPHSLTSGLPIADYAAIVLFTYFGLQTLQDAYKLPGKGENTKMDEELEEAEDVVKDFSKQVGAPQTCHQRPAGAPGFISSQPHTMCHSSVRCCRTRNSVGTSCTKRTTQ